MGFRGGEKEKEREREGADAIQDVGKRVTVGCHWCGFGLACLLWSPVCRVLRQSIQLREKPRARYGEYTRNTQTLKV